MKKLFFLLLVLIAQSNLHAGPHYIGGKITNLTCVANGILIRLDSGVPENCSGTPFNWLFISKDYNAMISVVLICWSQKIPITVYTNGIGYSGYGEINQIDPEENN